VLIAELLFKNDYGQSNRKDLLKAVHYLIRLWGRMERTHAAKRTHAVCPYRGGMRFWRRGHIILMVWGFYERDSLIDACEEYLNALRMMEGHFEEKVLAGHKARFMALTYNRLVELFSAQYMQEPAIYCGKQSLAYDKKAQSSSEKIANTYYFIGKQYDKLQLVDSASYYYDMALELMPDRNNMIYRDIVSSRALFKFLYHNDTIAALDSLKSMAEQASNEAERINRCMTIGYIYYLMGQYDSAKAFGSIVVEKDSVRRKHVANYLHTIAKEEGDTVKANQYALILAEVGATSANNQARVSQLNDMFQQHLQVGAGEG
jgi:hypothetical protein